MSPREHRKHAELLPLVRAGVAFTDGKQLEREDHESTERVAALIILIHNY